MEENPEAVRPQRTAMSAIHHIGTGAFGGFFWGTTGTRLVTASLLAAGTGAVAFAANGNGSMLAAAGAADIAAVTTTIGGMITHEMTVPYEKHLSPSAARRWQAVGSALLVAFTLAAGLSAASVPDNAPEKMQDCRKPACPAATP